MRTRLIPVFAVLALSLVSPAFGSGQEDAILKLAESDLRAWASNPTIVNAVRAQNQQTANLTEDDIQARDRQWRSELLSDSKPMIQALMANVLSSFLSLKKRSSDGLITETIVMDGVGLSVGISDVTTDYWQGDEDKWRATYLAGPGSIHIGEIRRDESTQRLQRQLSLPVIDPATRKAIGAVSIGIDIGKLPRR